jgi:hypothetical protein
MESFICYDGKCKWGNRVGFEVEGQSVEEGDSLEYEVAVDKRAQHYSTINSGNQRQTISLNLKIRFVCYCFCCFVFVFFVSEGATSGTTTEIAYVIFVFWSRISG